MANKTTTRPLASVAASSGRATIRTPRSVPHLVYTGDGRYCGSITPDGWLEKRVDSRRHMLKKPPGWCTDAHHIDELEAIDGKGVRLIDEHGRIWEAELTTFSAKQFPVRRGFGEQVGLALDYWRVSDPSKPEQNEHWPEGSE